MALAKKVLAGALVSGLVALFSGVGESVPAAVELLGVLALVAGAVFVRARLARPLAPSGLETSLVTLGMLAFGAAVILGGHAGQLVPSPMRLGLVRLLAVMAAASLGLALLAPRLFREKTRAFEEDGPTPRPGFDAAFVLAAGFALHAFVFFSYPPLVGFDTFANLMEPRFLQYSPGQTYHHPPLYGEIITALGGRGSSSLVLGFTGLVLLQHALVLGLALAVQHMAKTVTRSGTAGLVAGLATALDPQLTLYSQAILTEALAIVALGLALAFLFEATRRRPADAWLLGAGLAAAASTLIRQVSELWCGVAALWLFAGGLVLPRTRSTGIFLAGALAPILLVVGHNGVFTERPVLTSATGRNLLYRAVEDMPPLTDPDAPPGDPVEKARRLVWDNRATAWLGPYRALRAEGLSDAEVDRLLTRFYFEQARKHPWIFVTVTIRYVWVMLSVPETYAAVAANHNATLSNEAASSWRDLPRAGDTPRLVAALEAVEVPARLVVLALALAAPLVARGRARSLALLALATAFYYLVMAALTNQPILRYRLPAVPVLALGAGIALARLEAAVRRLTPGGNP